MDEHQVLLPNKEESCCPIFQSDTRILLFILQASQGEDVVFYLLI